MTREQTNELDEDRDSRGGVVAVLLVMIGLYGTVYLVWTYRNEIASFF
jgi:hypothetical protein